MLLLLLVLLAVLLPGGDNQEASPGPTSFHIIQISTFANSTWTKHCGSGWLGDLQIHGWDSDTGTAIFLKPWSKGNLSDVEVTEMDDIFRFYYFGFTREVQEHISDLQFKCEFFPQNWVLSVTLGSQSLWSFPLLPSLPRCISRAEKVCEIFAKYKGIFDTVEHLLYETCPWFLLSVLEAGKVDLQRQGESSASMCSGPEPGHVLLVCHVSGFYPKPVWVMWIRGEQEQQGTQQGDFLPNADGTWNLRATLDVAAGEAAGLACRVKHSSLGGQDLVLYWGRSIPIGLVILAIIVPALIFLLGFALWFWRRR
uniref:Ig-like domain-containing protein n=1 Tax=Marmota marmota marmota TaxID=9994 RepID=A0A8C6A7D9_MARMA